MDKFKGLNYNGELLTTPSSIRRAKMDLEDQIIRHVRKYGIQQQDRMRDVGRLFEQKEASTKKLRETEEELDHEANILSEFDVKKANLQSRLESMRGEKQKVTTQIAELRATIKQLETTFQVLVKDETTTCREFESNEMRAKQQREKKGKVEAKKKEIEDALDRLDKEVRTTQSSLKDEERQLLDMNLLVDVLKSLLLALEERSLIAPASVAE